MSRSQVIFHWRLPAVWAASAVAAATGGCFLLHSTTPSLPVSRQVVAVTSPARPLPAPEPTFAPSPSRQALVRSSAAPRRPRRPWTRSTPPDELAGPVPDSRLQQLMNSSYQGQYQGQDRALVVRAAWAWETQDLTAGGYTRTHLQAVAVIPRGSDTTSPAAVDVVCMWSGSFPLTGWQQRRLSTVRLTHLSATWTIDSTAARR